MQPTVSRWKLGIEAAMGNAGSDGPRQGGEDQETGRLGQTGRAWVKVAVLARRLARARTRRRRAVILSPTAFRRSLRRQGYVLPGMGDDRRKTRWGVTSRRGRDGQLRDEGHTPSDELEVTGGEEDAATDFSHLIPITPELLAAARGKRVVVFSAKFGGGHKSTADALQYWWEQNVPGSKIEVVDYFDCFVNRATTIAAGIGYTQSVRLFPAGWGLFYEMTRNLKAESAAQQWLNNLGRKELAEWLQENRIDLAVAVHPTPCGALSELRQAGELKAPVVTVVTDYTVHNQWIHPGTDLALVGSHPVRQGFVRRGVDPERIRVTGIPIKTNTALLQQRAALREKWGLQPGKPTVMVMTGAQGMMRRPWPLFHTVAARPVQGFFLCGKDRALFSRLKLLSHRYPDFRLLPFVRIVPELMCVSDVLVTKAGGLTTSEALAMELPMVIFHPIPGQEYANRDFLVRSGAAIAADNMRDLGEVLDMLCREPSRLEEMRAAIRRIRRPEAAGAAGLEMLRLLQENAE